MKSVTIHQSGRRCQAFTMIEIAISLAVIGFALVAIIGVLPIGMNVQKENREETVINQDAIVLLDALRHGAVGFDDLTNYVETITVAWTEYTPQRTVINSGVNSYTTTNSTTQPPTPDFPLTNGVRVVGLLATPKYVPLESGSGFRSNYVVAVLRSMSGNALEKFPQDNPVSQEMGLVYRLVSEVIQFGSPVPLNLTNNNGWDPGWVNYGDYPTNSYEYYSRATHYNYVTNMARHMHDLRLIFRWPVLPNGNVGGAGRQVYRTAIGGDLRLTNDPTYSLTISNLWLFRPTLYTTNLFAL